MFFSHFDNEHWLRVKAARQAQGLNRFSDDSQQGLRHPLLNARLREQATGRVWCVTRVREEWDQGSYFIATLACGGDQQECIVSAQTSYSPTMNFELDGGVQGFTVLSSDPAGH